MVRVDSPACSCEIFIIMRIYRFSRFDSHLGNLVLYCNPERQAFVRTGVALLRALEPRLMELDVEGISGLMQASKGRSPSEVKPAHGVQPFLRIQKTSSRM